jgi:multidrug efflux pump
MSFDQALVRASQQRLRPIVMTAFTTLMSAVPLILGTGPGAESRMVIGVVVFSGVALSAFLTIFVIPSLYSLLARNTTSPMKLTNDISALEQQYPDRRAE